MQELPFEAWGAQIVGVGGEVVAYSLQYPWGAFATILVVILLVFRKRSSGTGDGFEFGGLDFGDGDGDGGGGD